MKTRFKGPRWYWTLMKAAHCYRDLGSASRIDYLSVCTSNLETSPGESSWVITLCFAFSVSLFLPVSLHHTHTQTAPRPPPSFCLDSASLINHGTQTLALAQSLWRSGPVNQHSKFAEQWWRHYRAALRCNGRSPDQQPSHNGPS